MKDFKQRTDIKPYRGTQPETFVGTSGELVTREAHFGVRFGYMGQRFKAALFGAAYESLQPDNEDSVKRLSDMANYLTSINVEDFLWMVGTHTRHAPEAVQQAIKGMHAEGSPYDPITQRDAIKYARFGHSTLELVRVPGIEDETTYDTTQLPIALKVASSPGLEMVAGWSDTMLKTYYPEPLTSEY